MSCQPTPTLLLMESNEPNTRAEGLGLWRQGQFGQVWINAVGAAYLQVPFIAMYRKEECRSLFKDPDPDPEAVNDSKSNSKDKLMLRSQQVLGLFVSLFFRGTSFLAARFSLKVKNQMEDSIWNHWLELTCDPAILTIAPHPQVSGRLRLAIHIRG
ncbi:hypothetical protein L1887_03346 [Cichorium endivia]|nr:hypothetical protein L1887_03346 [Cichorium endivia]